MNFNLFGFLTLISYTSIECFVPASLLSNAILRVDQLLGGSFGKVSDSLPHEKITRRGIIQSAVRFFYDQPNGTQLVNLSKISTDYYDVPKLYYDYYGNCEIMLNLNIKRTFKNE